MPIYDPMLEPNRYIRELARKRKEQERAIAATMPFAGNLYAQAQAAGQGQRVPSATDAALPNPYRPQPEQQRMPMQPAPIDQNELRDFSRQAAQRQRASAPPPQAREAPGYEEPAQRGFFKKLFDSIGKRDPHERADADYKRNFEEQKFLRDQDVQNYELETQRINAQDESEALEAYRQARTAQIEEQTRVQREGADVNSVRSQIARQLAKDYVPPEVIDLMSETDIAKNLPWIKAEVDKQESILNHRQRMKQIGAQNEGDIDLEGTRQDNRLELQGVRGEQRSALAGKMAQERVKARTMAFKQSYAKERELELDIAGMVQDIEASPDGAPPAGFFERFQSSISARGIDPARMETWQAKQMVMELWARNQTGAAISASEEDRFKLQSGMSRAASPEQVEAAYAVMRRLVARRLRAAAVANPQAAREVADAQGLEVDAWLGAQKAQPGGYAAEPAAPAQRPRTSAPKPAARPRRARRDEDDLSPASDWE